MERYNGTSWSVGTESSSSVWWCSTLIKPPGGTVQTTFLQVWGSHCIRGSQVQPTPASVLFGMMLVCWNFVHDCLSASPDLSSMYKGFNPWRISTKTSATSMWPSPLWRSSGNKGRIVPGKTFHSRTQQKCSWELSQEWYRNVKSRRRRGCNKVIFLRGGTKKF